MIRGSAVLVVALVSCVAFDAASARAEGAAELATAEALFDEGKRLMETGDYSQACPKLAASLRVDTGIGTMLYLADCYVHLGQTASAWGQFREAAAMAASRRDAREDLARERALQLEPQLSKWVISVSRSDAPGMVVRRDGQLLDRAVWTTPVPVDPGVHVVEASMPGKKSFRATLTIEAGVAMSTVTVPPLEDLDPPASPSAPNALVAAETPHRDSSARSASLATPRIIALAAGGAGLVGIGAGTYWGIEAKTLLDDSNANGNCHGNLCNAYGFHARSAALNQANLATLAFAMGGLGLAAGAVLWLTAPRASPRMALVPSVGPHRQTLVFACTF